MRFTRTLLARVVGALSPGRITLELDGERTVELPAGLVPPDLRRPNTEFWLVHEPGRGIVAAIRKED